MRVSRRVADVIVRVSVSLRDVSNCDYVFWYHISNLYT